MVQKKRKKKYSSPFRIKVGNLVALRYKQRGNRISVLIPPLGNVRRNDTFTYREPMSTVHLNELWTDPRSGHDDGLALIGSRIRCFFPKLVLSDPHNATSRLLEGTVVNVVNGKKESSSSDSSSFMVDLLVDNKNDKTLSILLPFLKRVDVDNINSRGDAADAISKILSNSEQQRRRYEERIKGGKHKAVVRVWLSDCRSVHVNNRTGKNPMEAQWVIRKRVPTKLIRRVFPATNDAGKSIETDPSGKESTTTTKKAKKKSMNEVATSTATNTTYNKDFSLPKYLGDGNDSSTQQERNWRWEVGRYHNPCHTVLQQRPISTDLIEKLSYNFVGEVVDMKQSESQQHDTLAMVTLRLLVLPEHTVTGRIAQHSPFDVYENSDLTLDSIHTKGSEQERNQTKGESSYNNDEASKILLEVPIEELVIVKRKIYRDFLGSKEDADDKSIMNEKEMIIRHSYSFFSDTYRRCEVGKSEKGNGKNSHKCQRCKHLSSVSKRLSGVPHSLCQFCFDRLKSLCQNQNQKCDCDYCLDRRESDLISILANEVSESAGKLGSTLKELESYSSDKDSGLIATRFIAKGMNPVDFSVSPFSLAPLLHSASSKTQDKTKCRVPKAKKKTHSLKGFAIRNGSKSLPITADHSNGRFSPFITKEPFRSTSSRLLPYDTKNRKFDASAADLYQWKMFTSSKSSCQEKPRNLRQTANLNNGMDKANDNVGKKKLGRAARANQRRLLRSVASMGVDVDTLAGREANVRFDRSVIHGWGVFTDIDIKEGEMIIEYRGEIIGNTVAEKREQEYEAAKIGSDYMFRVDEHTVIDASKQGNVARFINARYVNLCCISLWNQFHSY